MRCRLYHLVTAYSSSEKGYLGSKLAVTFFPFFLQTPHGNFVGILVDNFTITEGVVRAFKCA